MTNVSQILVVEDNDFVRMQIVGFLKAEGYETLEATEGNAALDVLEGNQGLSMAIVDVRMEPMGGFEFLKMVRGRENKMPVILVTGDQNADILEQAGKHDVSAVLMKPVDKARLIQTIQRTLRRAS